MYIAYVEIANFRKLLSVRIDLANETTLFVGANNSGKTSAILALRKFLVDKGKRFRTQDFTLSHWSAINAIGKKWDDADDNNLPVLSAAEWEPLLPALDLWLKVENGELHHVSGLLPTLDWTGGMLGVRMRLEPKDLETLYREYRTAIQNVRALHEAAAKANSAGEDENGISKKLTLWPVSLIDFLGQNLSRHLVMRDYLLDPAQLAQLKNGQAQPQALASGSLPIEGDPLQGLIRVNEINAQRGLGDSDGADIDDVPSLDRDSQKLSDQLVAYYTKHLDPFETPDVADLAALQSIEAAQDAFDQRLHASFATAFTEVESMGYPGVSDPKLKIASRLKTEDVLNHSAAVSFEIQSSIKAGVSAPRLHLPESYNGLGYQNLISMIFRLMSFRDAWMRVGKAGKSSKYVKIEPIHLVLVEEPEAHLHAQVQQVFINKAYNVLRDHDDLKKNPMLHTQLIVSTHSSHVAHETKFSCLRYFRRLPADMGATVPISTVVNLSEVFGEGTDTERFVTRYLHAQHCDLFFADAAILVEGPAEKMLIPNFIREHFPYLTHCYITLLEINGSHAHRLRQLIEVLGLLTLVITDIDAGEIKEVENKAGNKVKKNTAVPTKRHTGQITNNTSLKKWVPEIEDVDSLLSAKPADKVRIGDQLFAVRVAYQIPVNIEKRDGSGTEEALPSTFEDALVFENLRFFETLEGNGLASKFREAIEEQKGVGAISQTMFDALRNGNKAALSLDIIWSKNFKDLKCPQYIGEGLEWLEEHLRAKRVDALPLSSEATGATA